MFDIYLLIVLIISSAIAIAVIFATRKIQYYGVETDNEIMARVSAQAHTWRLPSDMHKTAYKTLMKDVTILLLAIFQKIFRDKKSDHPYVALNSFANVFSAVFIYIIAKNYFSPEVGLIVSLLFISSQWIWSMTIFVGHTTVANLFFLIAVWSTQQAQGMPVPWIALSGAVFGMAMFSSASTRKYIIPFLSAVFFAKYETMFGQNIFELLRTISAQNFSVLFHIILPSIILPFLAILQLGYKKIVTDIYFEKSFPFLNKMIVSRNKFSLQHYQEHGKNTVRKVTKKIFSIFLFTTIAVALIGLDYLIPMTIGFFVIVFIFTFPNFKKNLKGYFEYYYIADSKSRFRLYPIYFARANKPLPFSPIKRGGWLWVIKYFFVIVPAHTSIFLASAGYLIYATSASFGSPSDWIKLILIFLLSLSPTIWGEFTRCPQLGRTYMPGLTTMLILIGLALQVALGKIEYSLPLALVAVLLTFFHSFFIFSSDVLPSRMAQTKLLQTLEKRNIREFYTYKTDYHNAFLNSIFPEILANYKIHFIHSIQEVGDGWILIPGTSSKAVNMESEFSSIMDGDFNQDTVLNRLLETKKIQDIAEEKFKTFGTSKIWVHEAEIPSYRSLILGDITSDDIFKSYGWLVHSKKIKQIL